MPIDYRTRKPKKVNYGVRLNFRVDEELKTRLANASKELGEDTSSMVRRVMNEYLDSLHL